MTALNIIAGAIQELIQRLVALVPQLIVALVIWWLGNYLLNLGARLLKKLNLPFTKLDESAINTLLKVAIPTGKVILVLIILDYLHIGSTIISALTTGLALTIAIALGLSFGKALEPEAAEAVKLLKKHFNQK